MASDWRNVMGAVAKQALGAKTVRALGKTKRNTRRRKASNAVRHSTKGVDRQLQVRKNYVESLEMTNPSDGFFDAAGAESDEDDYEASDDETYGSKGAKKPARKRVRKKTSPKARAKKKMHRQRYKSLAQVLTDEYSVGTGPTNDQEEPYVPNYLGAASKPDGLPARHFCYVTGQPARYKDASTGV